MYLQMDWRDNMAPNRFSVFLKPTGYCASSVHKEFRTDRGFVLDLFVRCGGCSTINFEETAIVGCYCTYKTQGHSEVGFAQ